MKTIGKRGKFDWVWLALGAFLLTMCAGASTGDFYPSYQAKIVGHLALTGKPAQQMFLQQEGGREYLYVRQASQQGFTVIDVTKPKHPKVIAQLPQQNLRMVNSGLAISETPDNPAAASSSHLSGNPPESVRVLDVSDPAHPRTVQTFDGVTSMVRDDGRSLIYVANGDGIWILSDQRVLQRHLCGSSDAISSAIPNCD